MLGSRSLIPVHRSLGWFVFLSRHGGLILLFEHKRQALPLDEFVREGTLQGSLVGIEGAGEAHRLVEYRRFFGALGGPVEVERLPGCEHITTRGAPIQAEAVKGGVYCDVVVHALRYSKARANRRKAAPWPNS